MWIATPSSKLDLHHKLLVGLPAHSLAFAARTLAPSPICDRLHRRLQPFRHLHDCSGCFRLERSPGGARTHWKSAALSRRTQKAAISRLRVESVNPQKATLRRFGLGPHHPLSIYPARDRRIGRIVRASFCRRQGCVFVTPKSERVAGRNSSRMSAPPVASSPPLSSCAQELPADQIALDPVNVRSRPNSVVSALVDAAFVRPLRCKIRQLICLKVSLRENLDHLRCLASANQWRRADFGNDGQGIGAVGT